jgi:hypothetical protein
MTYLACCGNLKDDRCENENARRAPIGFGWARNLNKVNKIRCAHSLSR